MSISVGPGNYMRPYRNVRIEHFPEGANQSFVVGDVLVLDTTADQGHRVVKGGLDPTNIVGIAAEKASGVAGNMVAVWVADEEGEFVAHAGDAQAVDNDDVGDSFGIVNDTTNNIWRVDRADTTNTRVRVVKLLDSHGTVNGRLIIKFLNSARGVFAS